MVAAKLRGWRVGNGRRRFAEERLDADAGDRGKVLEQVRRERGEVRNVVQDAAAHPQCPRDVGLGPAACLAGGAGPRAERAIKNRFRRRKMWLVRTVFASFATNVLPNLGFKVGSRSVSPLSI
jgi:hypothetical protein